MKLGLITKTNQKGQLVIPKRIRDDLGINPNVYLNLLVRGRGIIIYPVEEVIGKTEKENSYLEILQKTQGSWEKENWNSLRKKRKTIELKASLKKKKKW